LPDRYLGRRRVPVKQQRRSALRIARDGAGYVRVGKWRTGSAAELPAEVDPGEDRAVVGVDRPRPLARSSRWTRADRRRRCRGGSRHRGPRTLRFAVVRAPRSRTGSASDHRRTVHR
jgi:hypothetical protein